MWSPIAIAVKRPGGDPDNSSTSTGCQKRPRGQYAQDKVQNAIDKALKLVTPVTLSKSYTKVTRPMVLRSWLRLQPTIRPEPLPMCEMLSTSVVAISETRVALPLCLPKWVFRLKPEDVDRDRWA